jgi:hypothetical protein
MQPNALLLLQNFIIHKKWVLQICRKFSNEARHGPIPGADEHGRASWEEGIGSTISGRVDQGHGGHLRRVTTVEDDEAKKSDRWPMVEE